MNKIEDVIFETADDLSPQIEIKATAVEDVNNRMEAGLISPLRLYIAARRVIDYLAQYAKELEYEAVHEYHGFGEKTVGINGVKATEVQGHDILDYEQDIVYQDMKDKLTERKKLIDLVHKTGQTLADEDGVVVPIVKVKGVRKNSFMIKY